MASLHAVNTMLIFRFEEKIIKTVTTMYVNQNTAKHLFICYPGEIKKWFLKRGDC